MASSPSSSSPVTITVSSGGKTVGSRSMGLTSPVPRASVSNNNPNSPLRRLSGGGNNNNNYSSMSKDEETTSEYVSYTVHIPPTPDRVPLSTSQTSLPENNTTNNSKSYISGTIFTGGFNSVTRGHVIECSMETNKSLQKSVLVCGMKGCDEEAIKSTSCECGFKICRDCYKECCGNIGNGKCPGCKEPYNYVSDDENEEEVSESDDQALPLPSMTEFKLDKRLSLVKSFKAAQNHPPDFDHNRWLFETKGTYGYGNALWPKDGGFGSNGFEPPPDFEEKTKRPLSRKVGISAAIISPYR